MGLQLFSGRERKDDSFNETNVESLMNDMKYGRTSKKNGWVKIRLSPREIPLIPDNRKTY